MTLPEQTPPTADELRAALLDHLQPGLRELLSARMAGRSPEQASLMASLVQKVADRTPAQQAAIDERGRAFDERALVASLKSSGEQTARVGAAGLGPSPAPRTGPRSRRGQDLGSVNPVSRPQPGDFTGFAARARQVLNDWRDR